MCSMRAEVNPLPSHLVSASSNQPLPISLSGTGNELPDKRRSESITPTVAVAPRGQFRFTSSAFKACRRNVAWLNDKAWWQPPVTGRDASLSDSLVTVRRDQLFVPYEDTKSGVLTLKPGRHPFSRLETSLMPRPLASQV
ncbi:unnamed protein product [Schistocephalus solidus]|uniref:Uncharacterized protein n=1 Tax=Schistocephalus solidus TaxID=70667 RepID=A0A183TRN4_SCHSO|nr:unnamed protein product [Schistocephalus solidus]